MNFTQRMSLGVAAALIGAAVDMGSANADTLEVSASVPDACTVTPGNLDFGVYDPALQAGGDLVANSSFTVTCTVASDVNVQLDAGDNAGGSSLRRMLNTSTGDFLTYKLFQDPGFSAEWGDDSLTHPSSSKNFDFVANGNVVNVTGAVTQGQLPRGGDYGDVVQITLVFNP